MEKARQPLSSLCNKGMSRQLFNLSLVRHDRKISGKRRTNLGKRLPRKKHALGECHAASYMGITNVWSIGHRWGYKNIEACYKCGCQTVLWLLRSCHRFMFSFLNLNVWIFSLISLFAATLVYCYIRIGLPIQVITGLFQTSCSDYFSLVVSEQGYACSLLLRLSLLHWESLVWCHLNQQILDCKHIRFSMLTGIEAWPHLAIQSQHSPLCITMPCQSLAAWRRKGGGRRASTPVSPCMLKAIQGLLELHIWTSS